MKNLLFEIHIEYYRAQIFYFWNSNFLVKYYDNKENNKYISYSFRMKLNKIFFYLKVSTYVITF